MYTQCFVMTLYASFSLQWSLCQAALQYLVGFKKVVKPAADHFIS